MPPKPSSARNLGDIGEEGDNPQPSRVNVQQLRAAVPVVFSGSSTKPSPEKWISSFESKVSHLGYDCADALEFVTDDRFYMQISKRVEVKTGNWEAVKQHMLTVFKGPSTLARDKDAFKRLKQGSSTVAYYYDMFTLAADDANISKIDEYVLDFVRGLNEDIKAKLPVEPLSTVVDAYHRAQKVEDYFAAIRGQDHLSSPVEAVLTKGYPPRRHKPYKPMGSGGSKTLSPPPPAYYQQRSTTTGQASKQGAYPQKQSYHKSKHSPAGKGASDTSKQCAACKRTNHVLSECRDSTRKAAYFEGLLRENNIQFPANEVAPAATTPAVAIPGRIDGRPFTLAVDSGATRTCISDTIIPEHRKSDIKPEPDTSLVSAGSKNLELLGSLQVELSIGDKSSQIKAFVVKNLSRECLVGWDAHRALGIISDGEKGEVRCGGITFKITDHINHLGVYSVEEIIPVKIHVNEFVNKEQAKQCQSLVNSYRDVFMMPGDTPQKSLLPDVSIAIAPNVPLPPPVPPRRLDASKSAIVDQYFSTLKMANMVEPSTSPIAAPVHVIRKYKEDGTFKDRVVCAFDVSSNKIVPSIPHPMPTMQDVLDSIEPANMYCSGDLSSAYHLLGVEESSRWILSVITAKEQLQFMVLPFGLNIAPALFDQALSRVYHEISDFICRYFDDQLFSVADFKSGMVKISRWLTFLRKWRLKLDPYKVELFATKIKFLGTEVSSAGISPSPKQMKRIFDLRIPSDTHEVRCFLGAVQVLNKYCPMLAEHTAPWYNLLHNKTKFAITTEHRVAFDKILDLINSPLVLHVPNYKRQHSIIVESDASKYAIGAIIFIAYEDKAGGIFPITACSRQFTPTELNYHTTDREALGIYWSVIYNKDILFGKHFRILTDHKATVAIRNPRAQKGGLLSIERRERWRADLLSFDFEIEYRAGKLNHVADALSRLSATAPSDSEVKLSALYQAVVPTNPLLTAEATTAQVASVPSTFPFPSVARFKEAQLADPQSRQLINFINLGIAPPDKSLHPYITQVFVNEAELLCVASLYGEQNPRFWVPSSLVPEILRAMHDHALSGHIGRDRTKNKILSLFYWPHLPTDVNKHVQACSICAKVKHSKQKANAGTGHLTSTAFNDLVAADIAGPFPTSEQGYSYFLIAYDIFTGFIACELLRSTTATEVWNALARCWIQHFGPMERLLTDNGSCFTSQFFVSSATTCNIDKLFSSAYHAQGNSAVERAIATIKPSIIGFAISDPTHWDSFLPLVVYAYNSSSTSKSRKSAYECVLLRTPRQIFLDKGGVYDDESDMRRILNSINQDLQSRQQLKLQQSAAPANAKTHSFQAGDKVMIRVSSDRLTSKLDPPYRGPATISSLQGPFNAVIMDASNRPRVIHISRLKLIEHAAKPQLRRSSRQRTLPRRYSSG